MEWDSEVQEEMKKLAQRRRIGLLTILLGILCLLILIPLRNSDAWWSVVAITICILATIGLGIGGVIVWYGAKSKIKDLVGTAYMPRALNKVFRNVEYEQDLHIPEEYIDPALIQNKWDYLSGNDYVQAEYNGLPIEFSDLSLSYETYDSDNDSKTVNVFKGLWLICSFEKEFSTELLLIRKKFKLFGNKTPKGMVSVSSGNETLEKKFRIFADSETEAKSILTPQMIEAILRLHNNTAEHSSLKFTEDGNVHVAVNSGRNFFEPGRRIKEIEQQIAKELRYVTDIIDLLQRAVGR